ncbi:hypothetical protein PIB30_023289 [Stylosanthes scabra]|uniref:Uncharacterized protein n=1 Tax=Stylosanthes scabra TaxID=79078 RepID=A0ABU6QA30_9FABA|nr:hypothetical protein [Stylosanthes scabra]
MRQFGLAQGIPVEPQSLWDNHNECLICPKNKNWWNEYRDWISEWLNRVSVRVPNYPPPVGIPLDKYINWHNGKYKAFLHLSTIDTNQGQHDDTDEPEEQPVQSEQAYYVTHRSPTPIQIPPQQNQQEPMFPPHGSMPPPSFFPESSVRQLSSYPLFMNSVAPYLSNHMDPHTFNTLYSMVNEFDMAQRARALEENQLDAQQTNHTILGRLSIDSHFNAPAASAHFAEDEEAALYTRYKDTDQSNSDDNDRDEDEEEDYLVTDGVDDDNEASRCACDASDRAAGGSTPKEAGKRYDLRTENSRRNPNRFTPSGWSTKDLKKGAS